MNSIPRHVAIIMDRNGEWAKKRSLARTIGHSEGAAAVKRAVKAADKFNIEYLSLFAFSTENWLRPEQEVSFLMRLLDKFMAREARELISKNIKLVITGRTDRIPPATKKSIKRAVEESSSNTGLVLNIALDYGGKDELVRAFKILGEKVASGIVNLQDITEADIEASLYHPEIPPVDFLIRTGGEERISNFMLWRVAYAELYFPDVLWPDFDEEHFAEALRVFASRKRRFGKTDEQL